jgi:hypothetical protein
VSSPGDAGDADLTESLQISAAVDKASGTRLRPFTRPTAKFVMPGLVPGIHDLAEKEDVDGRDEPGHDG